MSIKQHPKDLNGAIVNLFLKYVGKQVDPQKKSSGTPIPSGLTPIRIDHDHIDKVFDLVPQTQTQTHTQQKPTPLKHQLSKSVSKRDMNKQVSASPLVSKTVRYELIYIVHLKC